VLHESYKEYFMVLARSLIAGVTRACRSLQEFLCHSCMILQDISSREVCWLDRHLHGCCQGDHPFSDCFCMGLGMRWCWQHVQHVWWHWIYKYAMYYTIHVQKLSCKSWQECWQPDTHIYIHIPM